MKNNKYIFMALIGMLTLTSNCQTPAKPDIIKPDIITGDYEKPFGHRILGLRARSTEKPLLIYIKDTIERSVDTILVSSVASNPDIFDSYLDSQNAIFIVGYYMNTIRLVYYFKMSDTWRFRDPVGHLTLFSTHQGGTLNITKIKFIDRDHILVNRGSVSTKYRLFSEEGFIIEEK